jgi:tRNA modification GTPase
MTGAAKTGDTIFALATAPGRAGIAVVRVSGPDAAAALTALAGALPAPRFAARAQFRDPKSGETLDDGLCLWFPAPASFTGEDVAEFHIHGGRAALDGVAAALGRVAGLRPAEPGEFTRRGFENGKMDLTEAEALADLVAAETAAQRRQALRQLDGELGRLFEGWRWGLIRALAHFEAAIDFPEEDLPDDIDIETKHYILGLVDEVSQYLDDNRRGERLRDGVYIAILGAANVGKSSLLNALARRDAAIVSAHAGTTRDVIEVHLDLGGYPVVVADTAGLREAGDEVEREGVARALDRAAHADLRLVVFDAAAHAIDPAAAALLEGAENGALAVVNKIDLVAGAPPGSIGGHPALAISVQTGAGMAELLAAVEARVADLLEGAGAGAALSLTRLRHRKALEDCVAALARAAGGLEQDGPARVDPVPEGSPELVAEDLRLATRALGRITGRVDVEDVLDVIFRDFCIGK